ncbi:MAG: hypothetical protein V4550_09295 [Gemmatimonadota bacterium]
MMIVPLLALLATFVGDSATRVREGSSPQIAIDPRGTIRMVFGRRDTIFAVTSRNGGESFGSAVVVGVVPKMHLGNTRGPTIASSNTRSVVIAPDQGGDIAMFQLEHATDSWTRLRGVLNDAPGSAPEGLATVAADSRGEFHALWLDLRQQRQNQIYLGTVPVAGATRRANRLVYASPDGHVCECCRPSIAIAGRAVAVMFRNWLAGSRDMYALQSADGGRTFASAQKLGEGTWKLDACPMDGGSVAVTAQGVLTSLWRRESSVYFAEAGRAEVRVGEGRSPMMSRRGSATHIVWQDGAAVKLRRMGNTDEPVVVGEGRLPQVLTLATGGALVAWEHGGSVYFRRLSGLMLH